VTRIYQYLPGVTGVPKVLGELLQPLESARWLFLIAVSCITMVIGMMLEGPPPRAALTPRVRTPGG